MKEIKFKVWFDEEKDTIRVQILKQLTEEDLIKMIDIVNEITDGRQEPNILIDMTEAPSDVFDEELIRSYTAALRYNQNESALSQASNLQETHSPKVFKSNKDALEWLEGD